MFCRFSLKCRMLKYFLFSKMNIKIILHNARQRVGSPLKLFVTKCTAAVLLTRTSMFHLKLRKYNAIAIGSDIKLLT